VCQSAVVEVRVVDGQTAGGGAAAEERISAGISPDRPMNAGSDS
jgi:hypothetical protein